MLLFRPVIDRNVKIFLAKSITRDFASCWHKSSIFCLFTSFVTHFVVSLLGASSDRPRLRLRLIFIFWLSCRINSRRDVTASIVTRALIDVTSQTRSVSVGLTSHIRASRDSITAKHRGFHMKMPNKYSTVAVHLLRCEMWLAWRCSGATMCRSVTSVRDPAVVCLLWRNCVPSRLVVLTTHSQTTIKECCGQRNPLVPLSTGLNLFSSLSV